MAASRSARVLLLVGAAVFIAAAVMVLAAAGLPLRAAYTGATTLPGELPTAPEIGARAPLFDLPRLDDTRLRLMDVIGAPVVINFWATWCEPCRVEMPALQRFYDRYQGAGVRLLAINTGETPEAVRVWRDAFALTFDLLLDEGQQAATSYQLRGQPSTYIVSPGGIITGVFYGPVSENDLETALAPYLTQAANTP